MVTTEHRIPADVRRVVDRLSDAEWQSLILQLGRYATQKSRRFYWRTGRAGELPSGEVAESIVSKAFVLWLSGRRRWNQAEYADLQGFLQGVIDSLLSHAANGFDNRMFDGPGATFGHEPPPLRSTPESTLLEKERALEADETLAEIVRQSSHDVVVLEIVDAMRNGAATRRAIVAATGRGADVIDNGLKRLRRIGAAVADERIARRDRGGKGRPYEHEQA